MYRMPSTQSESLERFLYRLPLALDGQPPSEGIATLSDCPTHFSIDDYKAFGMLSFGRNIMYSNILIQLASPTIDFSKPETQILMLQLLGQAGVPDGNGDPRRMSHRVLAEKILDHTLLEQLELALGHVKENLGSMESFGHFCCTCSPHF